MPSGKSKRQTKVPNKLLENGLIPQCSEKSSTKWISVLCLEDNKEYTTCAKSLERLDGLGISDQDLTPGVNLIWHYRGTPYEVKVVGIQDEKPMPGAAAVKRHDVHAHDEDSSDSEQEVKKKGRQMKRHHEESGKEPKQNRKKVRRSSPESSIEEIASSSLLSETTPPPLNDKSFEHLPDGLHSTPVPSNCTKQTLGSGRLTKKFRRLEELKESMECKEDDVSSLKPLLLDLTKQVKDMRARLEEFMSQQKQPERKSTTFIDLSASKDKETATDDKFFSDKGVNLLKIHATQPDKYALALCDALFSDAELAGSCYKVTKRSTKPPLDPKRISLLEECVEKKFGEGVMDRLCTTIRCKVNQKCLDILNKRIKKEGKENRDINQKEKEVETAEKE